jgi:hypothetical protein
MQALTCSAGAPASAFRGSSVKTAPSVGWGTSGAAGSSAAGSSTGAGSTGATGSAAGSSAAGSPGASAAPSAAASPVCHAAREQRVPIAFSWKYSRLQLCKATLLVGRRTHPLGQHQQWQARPPELPPTAPLAPPSDQLWASPASQAHHGAPARAHRAAWAPAWGVDKPIKNLSLPQPAHLHFELLHILQGHHPDSVLQALRSSCACFPICKIAGLQ